MTAPTDYAERVQRTIPDDPGLHEFAATLEQRGSPVAIRRRLPAEHRRMLDTLCDNGLARIVWESGTSLDVELIDSGPARPLPVAEPVALDDDEDDISSEGADTSRPLPGPSVAERAKPTVPRTGLKTRAPVSQNEHMQEVIYRLEGRAQHVAMVAHCKLGSASVSQKVPFERAERDMSPDYLSRVTGMSEDYCRKGMADAVKRGLFVRLDRGKGGRHGANKARYRACCPVYGDV
ncbi:hypothetical protein [Pseudonocardia sp. D17]|uniref:hypothetical protein n=1 Tax=Pseudonocardia sp. D17 TaxID=882661 RepID=UPI002B384931|nr:hypothetical protein PSD17_66550 [Pseudonocardia sp. D17]